MTSNKKNRSDHQNNKNGFSLAEVIIVVSILGIIMSVSFATLGRSNEQLSLKQAQADILFALEEAQNRAATGFGTKKHGVHFDIDADEIVIFERNVYNEFNPGLDQKINLPPNISITSTGPINIIFERIKATTTDNTDIIISHTSGGIKTITITQNGKISAQ